MRMAKQSKPEDTDGSKVAGKFALRLPESPFARTFVEAVFAGLIILLLIGGWLTLRSDRTAEMIQAKIPTKAAQIEMSGYSPVVASTEDGDAATKENAHTPEPLPPAPIEGLTENYEQGVLPIARMEDELTPFQAYRRPFKALPGKSLVSIVVVDYGLSEKISQSLLDNLPEDISFVLMPYAKDADVWGKKAREAGHEFWLGLPMQTQNTNIDTGPLTIHVNASMEENNKRLFKLMSSAVGYAGLVSQQNHVFVKTDTDVSPVMKQIFGRGLAFAESNPAIPAYGLSMAMEYAYPYVQNTYWLDESLRPNDIDRMLRTIERQAQLKGRVVAFVHPYPVAIRKLQDWIKTNSENNIQLAPLSAMAQ